MVFATAMVGILTTEGSAEHMETERGWRSKQVRLAARGVEAEILVRECGGHAPALRAVEQAQLHQVRLVDLLDGVFFLAERRRNRVQPYRPARILLDDGEHQVAVH